VQLGQDARPQRAGAGDQQSVIGRDPEQIVQRPRDMAKMRLGTFDLRALVARLRPAPLLVATVYLVAEGGGLGQSLRRSAKDAREALVDERHAHAPSRRRLR
jgi:hypothetical protein